PTDVALDSNGNIYVANCWNSTVTKLSSNGQFITEWGTGYWRPQGIDIDLDDYVYVIDIENNAIQKFTSDGQFVKQWGGEGSDNGQFDLWHQDASNQDGGGIAIDPGGAVYVADTFNNRVQKFTLDGQFVTKWGGYGSDNGQFDRPVSIAVDSNGNVYVVDAYNSRIQKFTPNGVFITKWGSYGLNEGEFSFYSETGLEALAITIDANNYVYVIDGGGPFIRIQKFDPNGQFVAKLGSGGTGDGELYLSRGIETDKSGHIYVADKGNHRLQKLTSNGQFITKWGASGANDGEFNHPFGIALDGSGNVYVAEANNGRVQKFTSNGQFLTKWEISGIWPPLTGLTLDGNGNVYVMDAYEDRILKYSPDGDLLTQWGSTGSGPEQFDFDYNRRDMATDGSDNVYVIDNGNHRIQKFTSTGAFITTWGSYGSDNGQFVFALDGAGIAVDQNQGYVYVADSGNDRIQKFDLDGNFILAWDSYGDEDWEVFIHPRAIAVDINGYVYVSDPSSVIWKFTSDGQFVAEYGEYGTAPGQLNHPNDLAIGPDGRMYIADSYNDRIQVFKKVTTLSNSKAMVIAGGGPFQGNNLWDATQVSANFAYRTLTYQGFTKETIYYLSSDTDLDLDRNGVLDDVDGDATNSNLQQAITSWASDADSLVIYLVDHGGDGIFRMSGTETLPASDLDAWLGQLQQTMPGKVTVIYDACESGSFISQLTPPSGKERIVITSTSPGEQAYFVTQGSVSFSNYFWTHVFNGINVKNAFDLSVGALSTTTAYQHPLLDANGNGTSNETEDYALTQSFYIGNGTVVQGDSPVVGSVSDPRTISDTNSAPLFADSVTDNDGIARVWAVIRPPNYNQAASSNPVNDLPSIDLMPVGGDRFEATYDGFNIEGTYQLAIYAGDRIGNTSIPVLTTVSVNNPLRRRAIIAIGGSQSDAIWPAMENLGTLVYGSLIFQGYTDNDIYFMSPVTFSAGVDGLTTSSNLSSAINTWALTNTQDVVIYLIGEGGIGTFELNPTETLAASALDGWIDNLQNNISGKVTVIYDAPQSGSFLPLLTPPAGKERILISSTANDGPAHFLSTGDISFSKFFWRRVLDGMNVRDAFINAKNAISYCQEQTPQLDDNGNGIGNEKPDGILSRDYSIGFGIMLAGDDPLIGSISPAQSTGVNAATIFAQDVTTTGTIEKVWAVITPSGYSNDPSDPVTDLPSIELASVGNGRYEAAYNDFRYTGIYNVSVYAIDTQGSMAVPKNTTVTRTGGLDLSTDIDNDGITDANEDANHNTLVDTGETDPNNIDTDGDGIQDGTELGYTLNDIGLGTDTNVFQPDLDPSTTTDPLKVDTDGDGFSDGREDRNSNGTVDTNEGDPNNPGSIPKPLMPWLPLLLGD
ncbi:C13 family peptidase, partial [Thermodesulfobacteriota bacterium]